MSMTKMSKAQQHLYQIEWSSPAAVWGDRPAGRRHYCTSGSGYPHTSGDGAAKRKKCAYCGARLAVQLGCYGVFVWRGDGRYSQTTAERLFARENAAEKHATTDPRYVVRWLVSA